METDSKGDFMKKRITLGVITTLLVFNPMALGSIVQAESVDEINKKAKEIDEKNNEVTNKITESTNSLENLTTEKKALETDVTNLQKQIDEIIIKLQKQEETLLKTEEKIEVLKKEIKILEERIEKRTDKLDNQARYVQTNGDAANLASVVLTAESFSDLIGRVSAVTTLVSANKAIVSEQERDQQELEVLEENAQSEKVTATAMKNEIESSKNNLFAQKSEIDDKIVQIATKYQLTENEKTDLINEKVVLASQASQLSNKLQAEEARIVAEQQAKIAADLQAEAMNLAAQQQQTNTQSTPTPNVNGTGFIVPANGPVTSPFGYRSDPFTGATTFHKGIDIAGGGAIVASKAGVVEYSNYNNGGYGYLVIIDHGVINGINYKTYYAHMAAGSLTKVPGQTVNQGEQIGVMGTTGSSTGIHLHFEIRENNNPVNPGPFIGL